MPSNFFMLCYYGGTIIPDTNNIITYIDRSIVFLNVVEACHLKIPKKLHMKDLS